VNGFDLQPEPEAEKQLAAIWGSAGALRGVVTRAQDTAERKLANDPTHFGRHLGAGLYRLEASPLVIYYSVDPTKRVVRIIEIHFRPSPQ
jgi:hypothetical protein